MHEQHTRNDSQKYTKEVVDLICKNLRMGLRRNECFIGIVAESTFYKWMKERTEFSEAVKIAEFDCKRRAIYIVQKAMDDGPQWATWWLERKHPDEFGKKEKHEIGGELKIESFLNQLPPDIAAEVIKLSLKDSDKGPDTESST